MSTTESAPVSSPSKEALPAISYCLSAQDLCSLARAGKVALGAEVSRAQLRGVHVRSARSDGWCRFLATDAKIMVVARFAQPRGDKYIFPEDLGHWDGWVIPTGPALEQVSRRCDTIAKARKHVGTISLTATSDGIPLRLVTPWGSDLLSSGTFPDVTPILRVANYNLILAPPTLAPDVAQMVEDLTLCPPAEKGGLPRRPPACQSAREPYGPALYLASDDDRYDVAVLAMPMVPECGLAPKVRAAYPAWARAHGEAPSGYVAGLRAVLTLDAWTEVDA